LSEVTNWSSNGFLQSAIDSSADCVMALDREGALVLMNKAALGVVTAEGSARIVGQHWSLFWPRAVHDHLRQGLAIAGHGGQYRFDIHVPTARASRTLKFLIG